jgi:hypothetical protein
VARLSARHVLETGPACDSGGGNVGSRWAKMRFAYSYSAAKVELIGGDAYVFEAL